MYSVTRHIVSNEICTGSSLEICSRVSVQYIRHIEEPGLPCVVGAPVSCSNGNARLCRKIGAPTPPPNKHDLKQVVTKFCVSIEPRHGNFGAFHCSTEPPATLFKFEYPKKWY